MIQYNTCDDDSIDGWGAMLKQESSRFEIIFSSYVILPVTPRPWGLLSLQWKWVAEYISGGKERPERKADNLNAICEPIVWIM
jgi:hypothetical protein